MDAAQPALFSRSHQACQAYMATIDLACDLCGCRIEKSQWHTKVRIDGTMFIACQTCRPFELIDIGTPHYDSVADETILSLADLIEEDQSTM